MTVTIKLILAFKYYLLCHLATISTFLIAAVIGYIIGLNDELFRNQLRTLERDTMGAYRGLKALFDLLTVRLTNRTVGEAFNKTVGKYPYKVCTYFANQKWTFQELHELSNKIGNYFSAKGFKKGDVVGIYMENCPQYAATWLGLSKIGVVSALVNTNLKNEPLKHSLDIVKCNAVIYSEDLSDAIEDLIKAGKLSVPLFSYSKSTEVKIATATNLPTALTCVSKDEPIPSAKVNLLNKLMFVYTSGTTGLPKAATITHARFFMLTMGAFRLQNLKHEDIFYTCLPLYHIAGGCLGVGQMIVYGTSMALRKKFSVSTFWSDCITYNATVIQYIGEICRYLVSQPPSPQDRKHKVRVMIGNGMRRDIWEQFVPRFGIKQVAEVYGSTEGNSNIVNIDGTIGAVGFIPRILYPLAHFKIIKVDERTGEIIRDPKTGLAIKCKPNEPGEFVGKVVKGHVWQDYQGYAGAGSKANEQKIARNVFKIGDMAFRSGDILVMDELGYFYFKDRCGDTYRWKGENVSTTEVEEAIGIITELKECTVYGVEIPGTEGKAGMAVIVDDGEHLDLDALATGLETKLPAYARPVFVRIAKQIETTGTYKLKKFDLQKEGFDITSITDKVYFYQQGKYVQLDKQLHNQIMNGEVRV